MKTTPGLWYVKMPHGKRKRYAVAAPAVKSVCAVTKHDDARLISAAPEMLFITRIVAMIPVKEGMAEDHPIFGLDGRYITAGDVRHARAILDKVQAKP